MVFQVDYKIIQKLSTYRVGIDITVKFFGESIYMLYESIVDRRIVFRLASASLFKYFTGKVGKEDTF